jgi:two-component system phosphate regulon sensor histidine kinase PhoR
MLPDVLRILGFLGLAWLAGLLIGNVQFALLVGALAYLVWLHFTLYKFLRWVELRKHVTAPEVSGLFEQLCRAVEYFRGHQKGHQKKLLKYLNRFREATSALPDAIVDLGPDGVIEWANSNARNLLGIRWPQDGRQRVTNLVRSPAFHQLLTDKDKADTFIDIASPVNHNVQLRLRVIPYAKNKTLLVAREVTQLKQIEEIRRDFVANVSHELRTPLTVISGYVENLEMDEANCPAHWRPILLQIQTQTHRMRDIIEELLVLARLEQRKHVREIHPVAVPDLIRRILDEAEILSGSRRHRFQAEVDDKLLLGGSQHEIYSAFSNLVTNAVQYTPEQGLIHVRWYEDSSGAHFAVADSGIGIPEEHLPRITERFYRVDKGRSRDSGGTGLGLAIVKHVLTRHHANLHIDSKLGVGSLFRCDFPPEMVIRKGSANSHAAVG